MLRLLESTCPRCRPIHDKVAAVLVEAAECLVLTESQLEAFAFAVRAYDYWWPRRRRHGGAAAMGRSECGHTAPVGAPCCRNCANKLINSALEAATT